MLKKIFSKNNIVELGRLEDSDLNRLLTVKYTDSKKLVIVDENTKEKCLPLLLRLFPVLENAEIFVLSVGEQNKTIESCIEIWKYLTDNQFQRKDLIVNLGGGVVTDIGGFVASVFKRGLDFINIPTTLLAIVDASLGGKTGVNLGFHKNQLGIFSLPIITICDPVFLKTLQESEMQSGKAEMLKHGLIASEKLFIDLTNEDTQPIEKLIADAIQVKSDIVEVDFKETGERKKLNFGHTVGHSLEGFLLSRKINITHGECVAWGMLVESYLSHQFSKLSSTELQCIEKVIREKYLVLPINKTDFKELIELMYHDKKNIGKQINFTLLESIGNAKTDCYLDEFSVLKALQLVFDT